MGSNEIIGYDYYIINKLTWCKENYSKTMKVLKTIHNAGFFSCCSIRLLDIMIYYNDHEGLPDIVESSEQFGHYKSYAMENLIPHYFQDKPEYDIPYSGRKELIISDKEPQFSDYRTIQFENVKPFIEKYFTPSSIVGDLAYNLAQKYAIDYSNTCAVFYRGNDKNRETTIASYSEFIRRAKEIREKNPDIKFLVQPDERQFLHAFLQEFPDSIWFTETPCLDKQDSCMFFELPQSERRDYGTMFYAAVLNISRCKHLITHSGNGGNWAVFYRGHGDNLHQWLIDKWVDE